jgi:hypothetical protein
MIVADHLPPELKLAGLLHDAAETYLGDLVRPLKHSTFGQAYMEAEESAEAVIALAFGLAHPIPAEVMAADHDVLVDLELPESVGLRWTGASTPNKDEEDFLMAFMRYRELLPVPQPGLIIGLAGRMQAGKDTVGGFLVERGFTRLAFADKLRGGLLALDPRVMAYGGSIPLSTLIEKVGWDKAKTEFEDVRRLLQRYGTEGGRNIHGQDCWVDALRVDMKPGVDYVITDVRFPNEAEAIHEWGGKMWRVERPTMPRAKGDQHISETALNSYPYDQIIINDGSLGDLHVQVMKALDRVGLE